MSDPEAEEDEEEGRQEEEEIEQFHKNINKIKKRGNYTVEQVLLRCM